MFGQHRRRREERRLGEKKSELDLEKKKFKEQTPQREKEEAEMRNLRVKESAENAKKERGESYNEGIERAKNLFNQDFGGLSPEKRKALQYEANRNIDRSMESANRKLLGQQGQRGIVGKGGVGYAQQRDLQRMGQEAQGQVHRDLDKLNSDLELKKLAAAFNIGQGESAQGQLDKQAAKDELELFDEKKRQRNYEEQINRLFNRV